MKKSFLARFTAYLVVTCLAQQAYSVSSYLCSEVHSDKVQGLIPTPAGPLQKSRNYYQIFQTLFRTGKPREAMALQDEVESILSFQKMEFVKEAGISNTMPTFVRFENGTLGIWKPSTIKSGRIIRELGPSEVAAYKLDRFLGINRVPVTVFRSFRGVRGTVQLLVGDLVDKELSSAPAELNLFDYLIGNADRSNRNYLITKEGSIVAIDNGFSLIDPGNYTMVNFNTMLESTIHWNEVRFKAKLDAFFKEAQGQGVNLTHMEIEKAKARLQQEAKIQTLQQVSAFVGTKESYLKLKNTAPEQFEAILIGLIDDSEIQKFLQRRLEILVSVEKARSQFGDQIFTVGPASPIREIYSNL